MLPCQERLDAECFRENPAWAKQAFAYRLLHLLTPPELTRRLPAGLGDALIAPGVEVPPGLVLPDGTVVPPGTILPSTWSPGDPVPPGITITTGTVFPSGWTPRDPVPEGVILEPGAQFPEGWTPPDPLPAGVMPTLALSPEAMATGGAASTFISPSTPGPVHRPGGGPPAVCPPPALLETFSSCTSTKYSTQDVHTPFSANVGTWYSFLHGGNSGNNFLWTQPGYFEQYAELLTRDNYVYIQDTDVFNIRCSTQIKVQSKRTMGGGLKAELRIYNGQPPAGTLLWSTNLTDSSSATTQTFTHGQDFSGYSNLFLCVYVFDIRRQRVYKVEVPA